MPRVAAPREQHTPEQLAARYQKHEICAWLAVTQDWSQLRIVAGCRFHKIGSILLRQGRITDASWAAPEMLAALATSKAGSGLTLLPWKDAAPVCSTTSKLVADATRGWHRKTHWLHHSNVREAVFAVLVVSSRLHKSHDALPAPAPKRQRPRRARTAYNAGNNAALPLLPPEIWLHVMQFFHRQWWT